MLQIWWYCIYIYETFEFKYINVWRKFLLAEGKPRNRVKNKREEEKDKRESLKRLLYVHRIVVRGKIIRKIVKNKSVF